MEALGGPATLTAMSHDDDASYKTLFSAPEVVRNLILGFIPDDWLHGLDYRTLERVSGSYVTDDLRDRADDIVWRVQVGGEWVYLYILIEFQSTVDPWMAVRIMTYVGLLYQDLSSVMIRRNSRQYATRFSGSRARDLKVFFCA